MGQMADVASGREDRGREKTDEEGWGYGVGETGRREGVQSRLGQKGRASQDMFITRMMLV